MLRRMILHHKLAGERSIAVQRYRAEIPFRIDQRADDRRRRAVRCEQGEGGLFRNTVILYYVVAIHRGDGVPCHGRYRLARSEQLRQMDLDRIHAGHMMHHYAHFSSIAGQTCLPFHIGKSGGERGQ